MTNVGPAERAASAVAGAVLALMGLRRRSVGGAAMALAGAALLKRGLTGQCDVYQAMGVHSYTPESAPRSRPFSPAIDVEQSITISRPVADVYAFWRDLNNLTRVMPHLCQVRGKRSGESHWEVETPLRDVEWNGEMIADEENRLIAWHTLPGSDIAHAGVVEFKEAPTGRGTEVRLYFRYRPPMGALGAAVAKATGISPGDEAREGLRRLKQLLETGEVARTATTIQGMGAAGQQGRPKPPAPEAPHSATADELVTEASEESFPASDAPAWTARR